MKIRTPSNPPSLKPAIRPLSQALFAALFFLMIRYPFTAASAQEKPELGIGFSLAHYPDCAMEDYFAALSDVYELGGHSGFIWHWDNDFSLENRLFDIKNLQTIGAKTFLQISLGMLGNPTPPAGYVKSFADPDTRALYLDNVRRFAETRPDYLNLACEANFVAVWSPDEWPHFKTLYRQAYALIKELSPNTQVGVSYHYGVFIWKLQFALPYELGPHDYVAFTSYPGWLVQEGHYASIEDIPAEWYGIARRAFPDTPIIFSEIGWSSEGTGSIEDQVKFIQHLPRLMSQAKPEMITWVYIHDTEYFNPLWADYLSQKDKDLLEQLSVDLPLLFVQFNGMGLKTIDGSSKPAWDAYLNLNFSSWEE